MLEKPNLADAKIIACLEHSYGLPVASLAFLPIGNDANAWAYRVQTVGGQNYFLKVKRGAPTAASGLVPRYLNDQGLTQIIAPLPATDRTLWQLIAPFALIVYPFVAGRTGMESGLADRQWVALGHVLHQVHTTKLPTELLAQVPKETFASPWAASVKALLAQTAAHSYDEPVAQTLAAFWQAKQAEIQQLVARTEALGRLLQEQSPEFVLCHADIHTANLLVTASQQWFIVDWDGVMLAPKERDLMFIVDNGGAGAVQAEQAACFLQGYGATELSRLAMAYYRYAWVIQELGDFGERVFLAENIGIETQRNAARGLRALFEPGDVVEAAYQADARYRQG